LSKRFIFLNSHPIQYFTPLYEMMADLPDVDVEVWYCSKQNVKLQEDREFGKILAWDIPMLEGYRYKFFHNYARKPSLYSFWGLQNWGILRQLIQSPKSILIVNGWQFFIYLLAILVGRFSGHTVCIRGESPLSRELARSPQSQRLRKWLLGNVLFKFVHYFLYIGKQNREFYHFMGVPDKRLIFSPYCVDNKRFNFFLTKNDTEKSALRHQLGLPKNDVVILYSGKYISKKRPMDLLLAWQTLNTNNATLVLMGEGELRTEMEQFIAQNNLHNVLLTGFVNQVQIPAYYAAADLFVMCSDMGETWGLSTNEAMNLGLPLLLSDQVGCTVDLLEENINGYVYPFGDVASLAQHLKKIIEQPAWRATASKRSLEIIEDYSYKRVVQNLLSIS